MSERKQGWYWVKVHGGWECAQYDCGDWHITRADHEWPESVLDEIGPRIPTPDEPWQCVPVEPTPLMASVAKDHIEAGHDAATIWRAMLMYAGKPENSQ